MSQEFNKCLERGKIKEFTPGPKLAKKEIRLAKEDLQISLKSLSDGNFKWCIIQSYYSMFHSARALIYFRGYREKSHFCLIEAVRSLFVESGKLSVLLVEGLLEAKNLREAADYYGDFSETNAVKIAKRAGDFLKKAEELIKEGGQYL